VSGAEKAPTARPKALEPRAYGGAGDRHGAGNGHGFLRWHAGRDIKGGRETASASNGR